MVLYEVVYRVRGLEKLWLRLTAFPAAWSNIWTCTNACCRWAETLRPRVVGLAWGFRVFGVAVFRLAGLVL